MADINLEGLMKESESVIDLERKLAREGVTFSSLNGYLDFLDKEWAKRTEEKVKRIVESPVEKMDFPDLEITLSNVTYHIHGIVHGQPAFLTPGFHPRKSLIDAIKTRFASYHNPACGEDYLYEQHIGHSFKLLKSQELTDVDSTHGRIDKVSASEFIKRLGLLYLSIPLGILVLASVPLISSALYLHTKFLSKPKTFVSQKSKLFLAALSSEKYQEKCAKIGIARELPQPFDLEKQYLHDKSSKFNTAMLMAFGAVNIPICAERSLWTARELKKCASYDDLNIVHYLGGGGHTTQIAYFLKNPNYSFEKLEQYRLEKRRAERVIRRFF